MAANPGEWERYRDGEDKLAGSSPAQVMRETKGKANGKAVAAELRRRRG